MSHALLPAFVLAWRLDVAEVVGEVIGQVAGGMCGVRPTAARLGVPYTTADYASACSWGRRAHTQAARILETVKSRTVRERIQ